MRLRTRQGDLTINAVVGTSAVLLSLDMPEAKTKNLLGFYIRKEFPNDKGSHGYDIESIKHFAATVPNPTEGARYSTKEHPWQSFLWEDFSVTDKATYAYIFTPVYGTPTHLEYGRKTSITVTIPSRSDGEHEVHFNRGVAGSQAYAREFNNRRPDEMKPTERTKALRWLSKGLKEALLNFIKTANSDRYAIRGCFYEFVYPEVLTALKNAKDAGADVKIIYDSRHEQVKNDAAIKAVPGLRSCMIRRSSDPDYLQHNKFMVLLKDGQPIRVWLGSTNITEKAIYGHCNTGHIIRNSDIAVKYLEYWKVLKKDPVRHDARMNSEKIQADPTSISDGMTVIFSPRSKTNVLKLYGSLIEKSTQLVCGMFPFGFNKLLKAALISRTEYLKYVIIDKKDKNTTIVSDDVDNIIVYANQSQLKETLYSWAKEPNSGELFYNGTNYIHNKVILIDPLSDAPIVITGSANFSDNSILRNDENSVIIKGNTHVADFYFTEFARIFNHYSVRQDIIKLTPSNNQTGFNPTHLHTDYRKWVPSFYKATALKAKRRKMFQSMTATDISSSD